MKRIGISQRRDTVSNRTEERDALDVEWANVSWSAGIVPIPLCSNIEDHQVYLQALSLDGFILSGGNDIGEKPQRDSLEMSVLEYAKYHSLPVLGVCRGMQYINHFLGGSLVKVDGHVATIHSNLIGDWITELCIDELNSYHNYAVIMDTIGTDLEPLASSSDGVIEAFRHKVYPWLGIMWHPEREPFNKANATIIQNHFKV